MPMAPSRCWASMRAWGRRRRCSTGHFRRGRGAAVAASVTVNLVWLPTLITSVPTTRSVTALPECTATFTLSTLPPSLFGASAGNGWIDSADSTPAVTAISGCVYPDTCDADHAQTPGDTDLLIPLFLLPTFLDCMDVDLFVDALRWVFTDLMVSTCSFAVDCFPCWGLEHGLMAPHAEARFIFLALHAARDARML